MKKPKREVFLISGAVVMLLSVAVPILAPKKAEGGPVTMSVAPIVDETAPTSDAGPPTDYYERLRQRLEQAPAEREEPFRTGTETRAEPNPQPETPLRPLSFDSPPDGWSMRPTGQPEPEKPAETRTEPEPLPEPPKPLLRGIVRGANGEERAAIEVNGKVFIADSKPSSEWRVIDRQKYEITVEHEGKQYRLKLGSAPQGVEP